MDRSNAGRPCHFIHRTARKLPLLWLEVTLIHSREHLNKKAEKAKEVADGTEVDFEMVVNIQGTLAQFGSRLINDVSDQLMKQFVDNFKAMLSGEEVDNTLKAGNMMGSVLKSRMSGLFGKKTEEA